MGNGPKAPVRTWYLCDSEDSSLGDNVYFPTTAEKQGLPLKPNEFTICAYNVLSQSHVEPHNYKLVDVDILDICNRLPHQYTNVEQINSDVLCLQEVDVPFAVWVPMLNSLGYDCVFKLRRKADGVTGESVQVAWKRDKFQKLAHTCIEYYSYPFDSVDSKRDQGAVAVLLKNKETGDGIVATSTHIFFNPSRGDIKASQGQMLLNGVHRWLTYLGVGNKEASSFMDVLEYPQDRIDSRDWNQHREAGTLTEQIKFIKDWLQVVKDTEVRDVVERVSDQTQLDILPNKVSLDTLPLYENASLIVAQQEEALMYENMRHLTGGESIIAKYGLKSLQVVIGADCNSVPESPLVAVLTAHSVDVSETPRKLMDRLELYEVHLKSLRALVEYATTELRGIGLNIPTINSLSVSYPIQEDIDKLFTLFVEKVDDGKCLKGRDLTVQSAQMVHNIRMIVQDKELAFEHAPSTPKWLEHISNKQIQSGPVGAGLAALNSQDVVVDNILRTIVNPLAPLHSAYKAKHVPIAVRPTSCQTRGKACVDHILYSRDYLSNQNKLTLKAVLDLPPDQTVMHKKFFLPNSYEPSDHFPIMARFAFQ